MNEKILGIIITVLIFASGLSTSSTANICETKSISSITNTDTIGLDDSYSVDVSCDENSMIVYPNETAVYGICIKNTGNVVDTYVLDCPDLIDCCYWSSLTTYEVTLYPSESNLVIHTVTPYWGEETTYTITVRATSTSDPTASDSIPTFTTAILGNRIIDVATDKIVYEIRETVAMSLTNIGNEVIEGNPTFEVYNENNELVYGCYPDCWIPLEPGENFTCQWSLNVPEGKYIVKGWFLTHNVTYFDDAAFFILGNKPIEVTTDKSAYNSGENVTLMLTNICDITISGNPSFNIFDENSNIVFSLYIYLWIELEPGENFSWIWNQKDEHGKQVSDGRYRLEGHFSTYVGIFVDDAIFYIGRNNPPNKPSKPSGPISGKVKTSHSYSSSTTDPNGDWIYYMFDWDDESNSGWVGPFNSGQIVKMSHVWNIEGTYQIKVKAKDDPNGDGDLSDGTESVWSDPLPIRMPKNKAINPLSLQFLELFIERFPLLFLFLQSQSFHKLIYNLEVKSEEINDKVE